MARDSRYDILFEPVPIGPVTAPNRFYQVPHCTGMGFQRPNTVAAMRETKAEGGWGVVCTEYCSIHPSSDDSPLPSASLWDDEDIRSQARMVENVHRHGALAGVELWYGGGSTPNLYTREESMGPASVPSWMSHPVQCRTMDKQDIRNVRRWQVEAAKRAQTAGFDIVYVYATHGYLLADFLHPSNQRSDEYGGSLENRARLFREMIEETLEAVGDTCAVAVRFSADDGEFDENPRNEENRAVVEMLAELPDLWDINARNYDIEIGSSRFVKEGALEEYVRWVKQVTSKPVVSTGRFTAPDTMVRQVREGVMDLVGAARPSIADPFLPRKLREGRIEDIRECIGCNICSAGDRIGVPIRCTQNPAMGEEWRRGWHPEWIDPSTSDRSVLVVGAGPAGLEAARALGQRGYSVTLAEASTSLGGRVTRESALPTLAEWSRVRDWRVSQLNQLPKVEIFLDSRLDAEQILEFGADRVVLATGATWRRSGVGRSHIAPIPGHEGQHVLSAEDVMDGARPKGRVLIFDDDNYYLGSVLASALASAGAEVTIVTSTAAVASWSYNTDEQILTQMRLMREGVKIETHAVLAAIGEKSAELSCVYTDDAREIPADHVVMVTSREPNDALYFELCEKIDIARVGDCSAPGIIAAAVMAGHRYARAMDVPERDLPFRRDDARVAEP
ncbi:MAG: FAD-dependent oxidoreductase [Deltaproteobacteria bacterium]|nr:FAD-dependent oxidoreductase [Deltaproteobacteria bacterium]